MTGGPAQGWTAVVVLALAAFAGVGCVRINGGAVEVSWVVRSTDGRAITDCSCADPPIAKVRLSLVGFDGTSGDDGGEVDGGFAGTTPCAGQAQCDFSCQRQTGSTAFDIPPTEGAEMYEISVVAVGADGDPLPAVTTPAPVLRSVTRGQPTEVEAFMLVAGCLDACNTMNGSGICARP